MGSGEILAMLFSELSHNREFLCYRAKDGNWYLNDGLVPTGKVSEACRLYENGELRGEAMEICTTLFGDSRSDESFIVEVVDPEKYNLSGNGRDKLGLASPSSPQKAVPKKRPRPAAKPAYRTEKQDVFDPPKSLYTVELRGEEAKETYAGVKGYKFVDYTFEGDALPNSEDVVFLGGCVGGVAFEGAKRIFAEGEFAEIGNLTESVLVANIFGEYPKNFDPSNLGVFFSGQFTEVEREGNCFYIPYEVIRGKKIEDEWDLARLLFSLEYLAGYFPEQFMDKFWNRRRPRRRKRTIEVRVPIEPEPGDNGRDVVSPPETDSPDGYTKPERKEGPAGATKDAKHDIRNDDGETEKFGDDETDLTMITFEKRPTKDMTREEREEYFDSMSIYLDFLPFENRERYIDLMFRKDKDSYNGYLKAMMRSSARLLGMHNEELLKKVMRGHKVSDNGNTPVLPDYGEYVHKRIKNLDMDSKFPVRGDEEPWLERRRKETGRKKKIIMSRVAQKPPPRLSEAPPKEGDGAMKV
ncbi:MAG: hypothetical protein V3V26_00510 [Candidatus Aenigmarchaeota archaeon]